MHRAILVGLCIGVMAPLIDTVLVHRRLALMRDALTHTGFALGTTLISSNAGGLAVGVNQFLFGNLATVSQDSAAILLALFAIVIGVVGLTRNQLPYVTSTRLRRLYPASRSAGTTESW